MSMSVGGFAQGSPPQDGAEEGAFVAVGSVVSPMSTVGVEHLGPEQEGEADGTADGESLWAKLGASVGSLVGSGVVVVVVVTVLVVVVVVVGATMAGSVGSTSFLSSSHGSLSPSTSMITVAVSHFSRSSQAL